MDYFSESIKKAIRTVPDWPKPGVAFRDITTVLQDKTAFRKLIDAFVHRYHGHKIDAVAAVDARGFIIGSALAYELNASLVLVRKKGKLPFDTLVEDYELEYGTASVELHKDAFKPGDNVVLVDDLIATGGTMLAATRLTISPIPPMRCSAGHCGRQTGATSARRSAILQRRLPPR